MEENDLKQQLDDLEEELVEDKQIIQTLIEDIEALNSLVSPEAQDLLENLRPIVVTDDVYDELAEDETFADRLADNIAKHALLDPVSKSNPVVFTAYDVKEVLATCL